MLAGGIFASYMTQVAVADAAPRGVRVVILVDESGGLDTVAQAKDVALDLALGTPGDAEVAVVGFGSSNAPGQSPVEVVCPLTGVDPSKQDLLAGCIGKLHRRASGEGAGADHVAALAQALDILRGPGGETRAKLVALLAGSPLDVRDSPQYGPDPRSRDTNARRLLKELISDAQDAGVQIWPVGFGDADKAALDAFAEGGARQDCGNDPPAYQPQARTATSAGVTATLLLKAVVSAGCARTADFDLAELRGDSQVELAVNIPETSADGAIIVLKGHENVRGRYVNPLGGEIAGTGAPSTGGRVGSRVGRSRRVDTLRIRELKPGLWRVRLRASPGTPAQVVAAVAVVSPGPVSRPGVPLHARLWWLWAFAAALAPPTTYITYRRRLASASAAAPAPAAPAVEDAPPARETGSEQPEPYVLHVHEERHGDSTVYRYHFQAHDLGVLPTLSSSPVTGDRDAYVRGLYRRIEEFWEASPRDEETAREQLRAFGGDLLDELVPGDLQRLLWENRRQLGGILVRSDDPFIPWELLHLKDPSSQRRRLPPETWFLGQLGVVRWMRNSDPPRRLRLRRGCARHIIPDYPEPRLQLPGAAAERAFVEGVLGATAVPAHHREVLAALKDDDVDLLHFAGHGAAQTDDAANARLLLKGRLDGKRYVEEVLRVAVVRQNFDHTRPGDSRPVVVVNACQAGRLGQRLSTVGGFAEAFVQGGAGAFVGCLWSVGDTPAREFVEEFYTRLRGGATVSQATAAGREKARGAGGATWLAYTVYAHPHARLVLETAEEGDGASASGESDDG
jgi:hypothetical protein